MKISVIVPTCNQAEYLPRCLDSIAGQTYKNLEIICVNDGSTDGTAAILDDYAARDARIRVVTQDNSGSGAARNRGLAEATGDYVGFADSDDWLEPDFYDKLAMAAIYSGADIAMGGLRIIMADRQVDVAPEAVVVHTPADKVARMPDGSVCSKIIRLDLIRRLNLGFPTGLLWEDNDFLIRAACLSGPMAFVPGSFYNYDLKNENSNVNSQDPAKKQKRIDSAFEIATRVLDFVERDFDDATIQEVKAFCMRSFLPFLFDRHFQNTLMLYRRLVLPTERAAPTVE